MSSTSTESSTESYESDNEWDVFEQVVSDAIVDYTQKNFNKRPYRNDKLSGKEYVNNVLKGNENRSVDMFRMRANMLYDLCAMMRSRKLLDDTRYVSVEEQVCIFLYTIGHNESNRVVADRFQHSGETISRHFGKVVKAICKISNELIMPPDMSITHPYIKSKRDKYYPWFKNCIGAIDGTHISASVPSGKYQIPYRGRKISPTQNVMCACDFDMCFTFVLAGWEGTTNDSRILNEAISNPHLKFPQPPQGKYYVVDSGYVNALGFLAPYKGEMYHLKEYQGKGHARSPKTAKEQFNFAHSSLRNIIERCFGVLKARFPILKMMPPYSLRKQRNIVIACCALHNFIRRYNIVDDISKPYEKDDLIIEEEDNATLQPNFVNVEGSRIQEMNKIRDEICKTMGTRYRLPM